MEEFCCMCKVCSAKKGPKNPHCAPLQLYQVGAPVERVVVDIAEPFPLMTDENRYTSVLQLTTSPSSQNYAIPEEEATTITNVLVSKFFHHFSLLN